MEIENKERKVKDIVKDGLTVFSKRAMLGKRKPPHSTKLPRPGRKRYRATNRLLKRYARNTRTGSGEPQPNGEFSCCQAFCHD